MKGLSFFLLLVTLKFYGYSTTWTISNSGNTYTPATITIVFGDTVNFVISSSHDVLEVNQTTWNQNDTTALAGGFSLPLGGGLLTPNRLGVGTHYYVCTPHASLGMKGRIIVQPCVVPNQPSSITGEVMVCPNRMLLYSVPLVNGANTYTWTLPTGWKGDTTANTIRVTTSTTGGIVSVTANNTCGKSIERTIGVFVSGPPAQPSAITGDITICPGGSNSYSILPIPGVNTFAWTLPEGWSGSSSTTSITAMSDSSGGTISVVSVNNCGNSLPSNLNVTLADIPARPSAILGPDTVCANSMNMYSVLVRNDATSYTWTLPPGWSGTSTTNTIVATSGQGTGTILVVANNKCGSSDTSLLNISQGGRPDTPMNIMGQDTICSNSTNVYRVAKVAGALSYTWTLPSDWIGATGLDSISAISGSASGIISVVANNSCGASIPSTLSVRTISLPDQPQTIEGHDTLCPNSSSIFNIVPVPGATAYSWILPNGWTGSSQTNMITAKAGNAGGILTVIANNRCGFSPIRTLTVRVSANAIPGPLDKILGKDTVCLNSNNLYTVSPVIGATAYAWILPGGWAGSSTTNSISALAGNSGNISVTANNSCGSTQSVSISISTKTPLDAVQFIIGKSLVCKGSNNLFNASAVQGASSYTWTLPGGWAGSSTTNFLNAVAGNLGGELTVVANNLCGSSASFSFPVATELLNTAITISGSTLISNATGASYQWINCFDNTKLPGETNQSLTINQMGSFAVILNRNNCVDTSACIKLNTVSTTSELAALGISIFPNPVLDYLQVELKQNLKARIDIFNAVGIRMTSQTLKFPQTTLALSTLSKGLYIAHITMHDLHVTKRFLKL